MTAPDPSASPDRPAAPEHPVGRLAARIARRPAFGLLVLALLAVASALGLVAPPPANPLQDGPAWEAARRANEDFGFDGDGALLALFGARAGEGLDAVEAAVEALPWIEDALVPNDLPQAARGAAEDSALAAELTRPDVGALVPITFAAKPGPDTWPEDVEAAAQAALVAAGLGDVDARVTGVQAIVEAQSVAFEGERWRFMFGGALLGFVLASLVFRDVRATFLAGLPPLLGLAVSAGVSRLLGLGSDGFTLIVLPLLVLTIGFTDALHVVMEAGRARVDGRGSDGASAGRAAALALAWPCALTSLTTAIGFGSMAVSGNALVVDFGLSCAVATSVTFVCVIVAVPLLARTGLGASLERIGARVGGAHAAELPRALERVLGWTLRAPRAVAALGAVATLGLAAVFVTLEADRRATVDLADTSAAARTLARVDAEFGGVFPIAARLDWDGDVPVQRVLETARGVAADLRAEALVAGAIGPAELVDGVQALAGPGDVGGIGAAGSLGAVALALVPPRFAAPFVDLNARRALVHARVPDAGGAALLPVFERLRARLQERSTDGVEVQLVGEHVAYLESVQEVTEGLRWSLALAAVLILITLTLAFRSVRLGLASVVPNLLPIGASVGGLALVGGRIDVSVLTALTLSLGIATDDTIHVLARYRDFASMGGGANARQLARRAVAATYPALLLTTVALTAAFGQLLTSSIPTIRLFGIVAATTLLVAFVADVLVLPATLVALRKR